MVREARPASSANRTAARRIRSLLSGARDPRPEAALAGLAAIDLLLAAADAPRSDAMLLTTLLCKITLRRKRASRARGIDMEPAHAVREPQIARPGSTSEKPPGRDRPIQRLARATGLLYLVLAVFGMFSPMVLESLVVPGDAQATADSILGSRWLFGSSLVTWLAIVVADVAISVAFYLLLALVLFGVHLLTLGFLLHRSRYLPRVFGALLAAAGVGYIADSLAGLFIAEHGGLVRAILLTPAVPGEVGLTAWLLLRGVRVPRPVTQQ